MLCNARAAGSLVAATPQTNGVRCFAQHQRQRRHFGRLAANHVQPRSLLRSMAPPVLVNHQREASERIALAHCRQALRLPQRRAVRVFQHAAELTHQRHGQAGKVALIGARLRVVPQGCPGAAGWVCCPMGDSTQNTFSEYVINQDPAIVIKSVFVRSEDPNNSNLYMATNNVVLAPGETTINEVRIYTIILGDKFNPGSKMAIYGVN